MNDRIYNRAAAYTGSTDYNEKGIYKKTMANFTREAIKSTFIRLLEEKQFSEITVKNIVEECGINRNSFYYHFQDLPSLLEEIIREESDAVIKKYSSVNSIVECFDAIEEFASNRKRAILHIYRSVNRDVFERYLMKTGEYFLSRYIDALAAEGEIDQFLISRNKSLIVGYYKCLFFGVIIEWLESGMDEQLAKDFRRIFRLKADTADGLAEILRSQI